MKLEYPWDIIGHQGQLQALEEELRQGNIARAYLFSGPRQVGKFTLAKTLAGILQCPREFCRVCKTCKAILGGFHPDTVVLQDRGETITIDTVRDLIQQANLTAQSRYRIFLIENIERMPVESQNSFLKTLEEPPGQTLFLLTSSRVTDVLPTIQSRVRNYAFFNIDSQILRDFLEKTFPENPVRDEVVNMAQGRPGLAIALMKEMTLLGEQRAMYATIERFLEKNDLADKMAFTEKLVSGEEAEKQLEFFFDAFTRFLRKLLYEYLEEKNHPLASRFRLRDIVNLFESLEKTRYLMQRNINKRLALENFFLQTEVVQV